MLDKCTDDTILLVLENVDSLTAEEFCHGLGPPSTVYDITAFEVTAYN